MGLGVQEHDRDVNNHDGDDDGDDDGCREVWLVVAAAPADIAVKGVMLAVIVMELHPTSWSLCHAALPFGGVFL